MVSLVGAHVHVEGGVFADADGDTTRFDDSSVGVCLFGCVDEGDDVLSRGVALGMAYYGAWLAV